MIFKGLLLKPRRQYFLEGESPTLNLPIKPAEQDHSKQTKYCSKQVHV